MASSVTDEEVHDNSKLELTCRDESRVFQRAKENKHMVCTACFEHNKTIFFSLMGMQQHYRDMHRSPSDQKKAQELFRKLHSAETRSVIEKLSEEKRKEDWEHTRFIKYKVTFKGEKLEIFSKTKKEAAKLAGVYLK